MTDEQLKRAAEISRHLADVERFIEAVPRWRQRNMAELNLSGFILSAFIGCLHYERHRLKEEAEKL